MTTADTQPDVQLEVGDIVTISDKPYPLTWTILAIHTDTAKGPIALLESGMTSRRHYFALELLTPFKENNP